MSSDSPGSYYSGSVATPWIPYVTKLGDNLGRFDCSGFVAKVKVAAEVRFYLVTACHCDRSMVHAEMFGRSRYLKGRRRLQPPTSVDEDIALIRLPQDWVKGLESQVPELGAQLVGLAQSTAEAHVHDGRGSMPVPLAFGDGSYPTQCESPCPASKNGLTKSRGFVYGWTTGVCATDGMSGAAVLSGGRLAAVLVERHCQSVAVSPIHTGLKVDGGTLLDFLRECDPLSTSPGSETPFAFTIK